MRDKTKYCCSVSFHFCVPQPRPNIEKYQRGQFAYGNACLRKTYSMRGWAASLLSLFANGPPTGWSRLCLVSAPLTRGLHVLGRDVLALFTHSNGRESPSGLFPASCKSASEDIAATVAHPGFKETEAVWDGCRRWIWKEAVGSRWDVHLTRRCYNQQSPAARSR